MNENALIAKLRRQCKNKTQKEVAEALGISPGYLSDILNGNREPGPSVLEALGLRRMVRYEPTNGTSQVR